MDRLRYIKEELNNNLDVALDRLQGIWDEIGILGQQRKDRTQVVMQHLRNLLDEMVQEEESLKKKLMRNVETYGDELLKLCKELSLPPVEPEAGHTILQLEKELRLHVDKLAKAKHERLKELKVLQAEDQRLCDRLAATPYYIPTGAVPSINQLKELEQHVNSRAEEKERRYKLFKESKATIIKLLQDLDEKPNTSFEHDIACEEEDSFLLSSEAMKQLKLKQDELKHRQEENFATASKLRDRMETLWERLQVSEEDRVAFNQQHMGFKPSILKALVTEISRCEELKMANIKQVTEATRKELISWWDKCYYSQQQRESFSPFYTEDFSEHLLEMHDAEVSKVKEYYKENKDLLERVTRHQKLWEDYLEFERKAEDPNRFSNRGGKLLKELDRGKKVIKELRRVEAEVSEQIEEWEQQMGKQFLVGGVRFLDFINNQREMYEIQKESEKNLRRQQRAKQNQEEAIFGSTPAKKRFASGTTPSKTPKQRKLDEKGSKTPMSISRLGKTTFNHTSLFMSPHHTAPKSASKSASKSRTQSRYPTRRALGERNGSNESIFSHTTVSGFGGSQQSLNTQPDMSLASVGGYNDFAVSIPHNSTILQLPVIEQTAPKVSSPKGSTTA